MAQSQNPADTPKKQNAGRAIASGTGGACASGKGQLPDALMSLRQPITGRASEPPIYISVICAAQARKYLALLPPVQSISIEARP
jgi:hypothetical protein